MSNINISLVGEDPATTTIVWDGAAGGTMLWVNGVAYSRFTRLTLNGNRRALVAVEQSWDHVRPHFDTGNEYSDISFVDAGYGIHGGFKGHGFAETSIRRSHFVRATMAGVSLGNFNALDIWVWYSTFDHCRVGVSNGCGAGNFHVYNSGFRESTYSDLFMGNTGGFSARGNYSVRSKAFFTSVGVTNNPATIDIQHNVVIDPIDSRPIGLGNQGPGLIVDNVIRSGSSATSPVVDWTSAINAAAVQNGSRPVVHIPDGRYSISRTLSVPASDVQLAGDGYGTMLGWTGTGSGPVIRLSGASKATLRELQIDAAGRVDGLLVENVDQVGSRVYMDQAQLRAAKQTNLFVDGLDNTYVQLEDVGYAYLPEAVAVKVFGGPLSSAGHPSAGRTNIYSGASSGNRVSYEISRGASVLVS